MLIELSEFEYSDIIEISNKRMSINRQSGVIDQKRDKKRSNLEIEITGTAGEFAFCKAFGLKFDNSIQPRKGDKDCEMKGYRIDVKSSDKKGDYVFVKFKEYPYIDVFAFCYVKGKFVEILGYQFKDFVTSPNHIVYMYEKPCFRIQTRNLHKFKTYANP